MASPRFEKGKEQVAVSNNFATQWHDGTFCDITIKCGSLEMAAHRQILAAHSDWFLKAFTNGMLETGAEEIVLHDDEPCAMEAMIRYCYEYAYHDMADSSSHQPDVGWGPMAFNVHVFAIAEKYLIEPLQRFAVDRLSYHADDNFDTEDFAYAMEKAYIGTVDSKKLLRRTIMRVSFENSEALFGKNSDESFSAMIVQVPVYAADLIRAAQQTGRLGNKVQEVKCQRPGCAASMSFEWENVDLFGNIEWDCVSCGQDNYGSAEGFGMVEYMV